jgi:hypothetical protein
MVRYGYMLSNSTVYKCPKSSGFLGRLQLWWHLSIRYCCMLSNPLFTNVQSSEVFEAVCNGGST